MMTATERNWAGNHGTAYSVRSTLSADELDALWLKEFGCKRTDLTREVLGMTDIPLQASILEVGCNSGNQLALLREMGFDGAVGVDINNKALELASDFRGLKVEWASARKLPFRDRSFDLVFTSGVLSHIEPEHVGEAIREILRVGRKWFWGCEYYAPKTVGNEYLWSDDYDAKFLELEPTLSPVHRRLLAPAGWGLASYLLERLP